MTTYTLPARVSEVLAARLAPLADRLETATDAQIEAAALAFADEIETEEVDGNDQTELLTPADVAALPPDIRQAIEEGYDNFYAGKTIPGDVAFARLRARFGTNKVEDRA